MSDETDETTACARTERVWKSVDVVTKIVIELTGALVQLAPDAKALTRLAPVFDKLRELEQIRSKREHGPDVSKVDLYLADRISELEDREEEREEERARPVKVTIVKSQG